MSLLIASIDLFELVIRTNTWSRNPFPGDDSIINIHIARYLSKIDCPNNLNLVYFKESKD